MIALPFILVALFAAAFIGWRVYRRRAASRVWSELAEEHDLAYGDGGWFGNYQLRGRYRGAEIEVETKVRYFSLSVGNRKVHTDFRCELPDGFPYGAVIYEADFGTDMRTSLGGRDFEVGHEAVDEAFVFERGDADWFRSLFRKSGIPEAFQQLDRAVSNIHIEDGELTFELPSLPHDRKRMQRLLEVTTDFHRRLAEYT